jgi:corrinoid protein of di/trimethylamine methyltransferase
MEKRKMLVQYVMEGNDEEALELAKELVKEVNPKLLLEDLTEGMRELGQKFERLEVFLPELMVAADALEQVTAIIEPLLESEDVVEKEKVVMATVKGDVHEIGKNIVSMVLKANGLEVIDLGKDVSSAEIIKAAQENEAKVIGLSALMTTTMPSQKEVIDLLKDMGIRDKFKVLVGGAPVSKDWADSIGADGYAEDAFKTVDLVKSIL